MGDTFSTNTCILDEERPIMNMEWRSSVFQSLMNDEVDDSKFNKELPKAACPIAVEVPYFSNHSIVTQSSEI